MKYINETAKTMFVQYSPLFVNHTELQICRMRFHYPFRQFVNGSTAESRILLQLSVFLPICRWQINIAPPLPKNMIILGVLTYQFFLLRLCHISFLLSNNGSPFRIKRKTIIDTD